MAPASRSIRTCCSRTSDTIPVRQVDAFSPWAGSINAISRSCGYQELSTSAPPGLSRALWPMVASLVGFRRAPRQMPSAERFAQRGAGLGHGLLAAIEHRGEAEEP